MHLTSHTTRFIIVNVASRLQITILAMSILSLFSTQAAPLEIGADAPRLDVRLHDNSTINLGEFYDKGLTFIYFYPKADTPGCTAQACSLRDSFSELTSKGVQVIGVSSDSVEAQAKFRVKYNLPFPLVADGQKVVMDAFGVPATMGFAKRSAFLIKDGKLVWKDTTASTKEQAADLFRALESVSTQ